MSTATPAGATLTRGIDQFAASVRRSLDDLPAEEVEELTDGLEADLADRLDDTDGADLGDPVAYAAELRRAAGLPPRTAPAHRPLREAISTAVRLAVRSHPWLGSLLQFFVSLRPLWWVYRGVIVALVIVAIIDSNGRRSPSGASVVLAIASVVLSVQFGRGQWLPMRWMRRALVVVSVAAIVVGPYVIGAEVHMTRNYYRASAEAPESYYSGILSNGNQVTNVFAYDASGQPLTNVQLFDQDGKPLDITSATGDPYLPGVTANGEDIAVVPNKSVPGRLAWNVYPLSQIDPSLDPATAPEVVPDAPRSTVPALVGAGAVPTPNATVAP